MKAMPAPKNIWQNGIIVRLFTVYLATGYLAWTGALFAIFAGFVVIVELTCLGLCYRAMRDRSRVNVYILSYLGGGDVVWFSAGLGFIGCGGIVSVWAYLLAFFIWLLGSGSADSYRNVAFVASGGVN